MTQLMKALILIVGVALTAPAMARDLTGVEKTALGERVDAFALAMQTKDVPNIIGVTPPRIWKSIAEQAGLDPAELRKTVIQQTNEVMKDVVFEKMSMDLDKAEFKTTPDGEPYALIPTSFVMSSPAIGKIESTSHTLALMDEGKWYLLSVSDEGQLVILRKVYPGFAGVELPKGTMKALQ